MPTTWFFGKPAEALQRPNHGVERVGDADHESVGRVFLDAGANLLHDLQIDFEKIVAAHAGLARYAGGDDDDVGALDVGVIVHALECRVEAIDRRGLRDVERLALRQALHDVEQHHIASSLRPIRWASVPPIMPEPISAILARAMVLFSFFGVWRTSRPHCRACRMRLLAFLSALQQDTEARRSSFSEF